MPAALTKSRSQVDKRLRLTLNAHTINPISWPRLPTNPNGPSTQPIIYSLIDQ